MWGAAGENVCGCVEVAWYVVGPHSAALPLKGQPHLSHAVVDVALRAAFVQGRHGGRRVAGQLDVCPRWDWQDGDGLHRGQRLLQGDVRLLLVLGPSVSDGGVPLDVAAHRPPPLPRGVAVDVDHFGGLPVWNESIQLLVE